MSATGQIITDKGNQMKCWVEFYSDLYPRENIVPEETLDAAECMPAMEELDTTPSMDEMSKAVDTCTTG